MLLSEKRTRASSSNSTPISTDLAPALLEAWQSEQAIDHHCHPLDRWQTEITALELRSVFTEALDRRIPVEHVPSTVAYRDALRILAGVLDCAPDEDAILARRRESDPSEYANLLLGLTRTGMLLLDYGFTGPRSFSPDEHEAAVRIPQRGIVRLESVAERCVAEARDAAGWLRAVRGAIATAQAGGAVAIKTICAYRAGLRLRPVPAQQLQSAFADLKARTESDGPLRVQGESLCHALVFEAAAECARLGLPLQVHTGFGDPDEDLSLASPLGLRPLLTDASYRSLKIVLLHCYPYHREAAYLCSVYPDAYMDLSLTFPLAGADADAALGETLGLCPWTKLLYASDASRLPEMYLVAATRYRQALASVFGGLVERRTLSLDEAIAAGRQVLAGNARRLYPI